MSIQKENPKVLVVDDEKTNIDVLVGALRPYYKVVVALNGEEALKRLSRPPLPDLILLDVMMPGKNGYEVCREIKDNPSTREIPVIFLTGRGNEQDEVTGFQAGAVDYITKPFNPLIGIARINTHIELKRRGDMLERLAGLDGLTGIPNRRKFDEFFDAEWKRCQRHGDPLSVLLADIDYFKRYNDFYGHAMGDSTLKKVASIISQSAPRVEDLTARYGGEEFVCVLPQTTQAGACEVAGRILQRINALNIPHEQSDAAEHVTLSIGVASTIPEIGAAKDELVENADKALYQAKRAGRNQKFVHGEEPPSPC